MRARWRDPRIAPVYAAVVAFAVVGVFGLVSGHSSTIPQVRLVAASSPNLPKELDGSKIEIREPGGAAPIANGQFANGTYVPAAAVSGQLLCVQLPAPWSIAGATDGCVPAPEPKSGEVTLTATRAVLVTVVFTGTGDPPSLKDLPVTVRDAVDPEFSESGKTNDAGVYQPRRSLAEQSVCLRPRDGYQVSDTTKQLDGLFCTDKLPEQNQDLTLKLTRGGK